MKQARFPTLQELIDLDLRAASGPKSDALTEDWIGAGGGFDAPTLLAAYRSGVFPWPHEELELAWFCPAVRGVLFARDFVLSRRTRAAIARAQFSASIGRAFEDVVAGCAAPRRDDPSGSTWITPALAEGYRELARQGYAQSIEVWQGGELVGGLLGVGVDGAFSAESMFYRVSNASKFALLVLLDSLRRAGTDWIDIQVPSPHLEQWGARTLGRGEFLQLLSRTQRPPLAPSRLVLDPELARGRLNASHLSVAVR